MFKGFMYGQQINLIKGKGPSQSLSPSKLFALFLLIFLMGQVFFGIDVNAQEEELTQEQIVEEQVGSSEATKIEDQLKHYNNQEVKEIIPEFDPQVILKDVAKGKFEFNFMGILNRLLMFLFKEIYLNIHIMIKLIVLVILCAILRNLQASFLSESVAELAFYVCYIVIVSIMIISFKTALDMARDIIDGMVTFMYSTIPVLITLLVSGGNIASGGVFQPLLVVIVQVSATIMKNVFIPLIFFSTILSIVNNISDKIQVSKLAGFLKQVGNWALGLMLTVFIAILSIQGSVGAVVDGVTSKTAKFAIGAFIPVAGKYLADAADTVIGCTLLIKNAAGIAVMVGILMMAIVPLMKIFALIMLFKLTCVIIEPIAEKRIVNCMNEVASSLTFVLGIVASVAFMFIISVTAIMVASNLSAMVR